MINNLHTHIHTHTHTHTFTEPSGDAAPHLEGWVKAGISPPSTAASLGMELPTHAISFHHSSLLTAPLLPSTYGQIIEHSLTN